jgi:integrase
MPEPMLLSRAIKLFLGDQKASTGKSYRYVLNYMEEYTHITGLYELSEVHPAHLIEMIQIVVARPTVKSTATVNKYIKTIKVFFNWCIKHGFIDPPSPAQAIKRKKEPMAVARQKAMPDASYHQLVDCAKWDVRAYALVLFLGDSGDRIGGAAHLKWRDLDLAKRSALVTEKGQDPRYVYFRAECCTALLRWKTKQGKGDDDYVFSKDGKAISNDALGQYFTRWCHKAGIGNWGPHSLRHRLGYQMADKRIAPSTAAMVLGHVNVTTTLKNYYPRDWERAQQVVDELGFDPANRPQTPKIIEDKLGTG